MKVAQKMVLIPEEEYLTLTHKTQKPKTLRQDMRDILQGPRDYESAVKMSQLVGTHLRRKESEKPKPSKPKENFLDYFDPIYHRKVNLLLSQFQTHGIGWNEQKELTLPSGEVIAHSNIIDLIKEALVGAKKRGPLPVGWKAFIEAIVATPIPPSLFRKKSTLEDITKAQEHVWQVY